MRVFPSAPLAAVLAVGACGFLPTDVCGCTPIEPVVEIRGMVEGPDGAPVAGASVTISYFTPGCGDELLFEAGPHSTRTDGGFVTELFQTPPPACFRVRATGPEGAGLGSADAELQHTAADPLPFGTDPETNRIQVTLRLPAGS